MAPPLPIDLSPLHARPDSPVAVALSGGLDSTVLLHVLATMDEVRLRGLRAVHVHHGLHPDADRWQAHCETVCARLGIPLTCLRVSVSPAGDGPEAAARRARHAAFEALLDAGELLAVAHHLDDQAETFLLRALRASSPDGLAAMRPVRRLGAGWLWRPLLDIPRAALLAHAQAHRLDWVEDPSNADPALDRNFLRHQVMPLLRARWSAVDAAFARSAALSAEASALLGLDDVALLAAARTADPSTLDLLALSDLSAARRARVLRRWITQLGLPPMPADAARRVDAELLPAPPDAVPEVRWSTVRLRRWRDRLHAERIGPAWRLDTPLDWTGEAPLTLPLDDRLELAKPARFPWPVHVVARAGGERIRLPGRDHRHRLKHVLQERGVPPWDRERLPLLVDADGEVLAAGDVAISARLAAWLDVGGNRLHWSRRRASWRRAH